MAKQGRPSKNKINLTPTPGYVLIEPQESETKTDSGIYLPDSAQSEKSQKGKVLALGADEVLDSGKVRKSPCGVNEVVYYKKWGGSEVKVDGKELLFAKFEDILAVEKK